MKSNQETVSSHPSDLTSSPHPSDSTTSPLLLNLPWELRDAIYELALSHTGMCEISTAAQKHPKPALLQVSRQIRAETIPIYYNYKDFEVLVTADKLHVLEDWTASVTSHELRSLREVLIRFQLAVARCDRGVDDKYVLSRTHCFHRAHAARLLTCSSHSLANAIAKFSHLIWCLYDKGLPRSAARVQYTLDQKVDRTPAIEKLLKDANARQYKIDVKRFREPRSSG